MTKLSLGARFINAYNLLDHRLRTQYNFKTSIAFTDLIRRCSSLNQVIRVYESDLIDIARLRNAIIHNSANYLIAEPHEQIVDLIEKIARIIATPPLAIDAIKSHDVDIIYADAMLNDFILKSYRVGHSNIPVYKRNNLIGVLQRHSFVEALGRVIESGRSVEKFLQATTIEDYLREFPNNTHFTIASAKITIEEVLEMFNNRKLASIIVTDTGNAGGKLLGIITTADILDLMQVIEGY